MLFVTQFVFYLMVLFVRAANKGKVTHGKTNRVFYIFSGLLHHSGSCWSYVKDLSYDTSLGRKTVCQGLSGQSSVCHYSACQ